ncbi:MAG: iron-sulfur cluster-binding protein [Verrucomicrobia bacterium]|nr:iron-sulfur cluster-binding protein [Verrucomicrobiota bacterium]MBV8279440.1 iron-sulfur cluster-binding protein [Verrucomicrobiota bacterium]
MPSAASQFNTDATRMVADLGHRQMVQLSLSGYQKARTGNANRFQDWESARSRAAAIKDEAILHLDRYLEQFEEKLVARGAKVFWANDAVEARAYILDLARAKQARAIVKSKTMVSEEIHLNEALEKAGFQVVESDLGEFIVQLRHEPPYHIVFPAMHLTRGQISDLFQQKLGAAPTSDPEALTMTARKALRQAYLAADMGITGANFAVAETGMISITENEGNARLTSALPKTHVVLLGIEKILPRLADLSLFLPMLATAGTGQQLTCYNSLVGGPRSLEEIDGPEEMHVVLLDNGRTRLLADAEQRDSLRCIRCGACLNVCPIFRNVGGHAYGTTYQGPIGSVITPHLRGLQSWQHLSQASSLCGACTETCPVKIDLHHHLLQNRRNGVAEKGSPFQQIGFKAFAFVVNRPRLFGFAVQAMKCFAPLQRLFDATPADPVWPWTKSRVLPSFARKSFRDLWKQRTT